MVEAVFCMFLWSNCYATFTVLRKTRKLYLPAIWHWTVYKMPRNKNKKTYFWDHLCILIHYIIDFSCVHHCVIFCVWVPFQYIVHTLRIPQYVVRVCETWQSIEHHHWLIYWTCTTSFRYNILSNIACFTTIQCLLCSIELTCFFFF